jgi:predicted Zn finger-like uncharacterized protein
VQGLGIMIGQRSALGVKVGKMGDLRRELREEFTEYTCPNCAQKFQVQASVVVLSGTAQCPHCNHTFAAGGNISDAAKHALESKAKGREIT